ncbi:phage tail length tape measure family protein [Methylorubrum extorquens]
MSGTTASTATGLQLNDTATSLANGINQFQTLAQQGGQVY